MTLDFSDTQGLLVRGYGGLRHATFLLFAVTDERAARATLRNLAGQVSTAAAKPAETAVNVALTAAGMRALGVPAAVVDSFSAPFAEGMTTEHRSRLLGDSGDADPRRWAWGGPSTTPVHVLVLVYAATATALRRRAAQIKRESEGLSLTVALPTDELTPTEPFGFRDGLSQPKLSGLGEEAAPGDVELGEFVLGYRNAYGRLTERPLLPADADPRGLLPRTADGAADLGRNGSYLVFRQLRQDVDGFWAHLRERAGGEQPARRLAAKMVGRWPSGAPLVLAPERDEPALAEQDFAYHAEDPHGLSCPLGAHVRRANPRDSLDPDPGSVKSVAVNNRHRLLRRGRSYTIDGADGSGPDERGLHFLCLSANLARQYEFVQHTWVNSPVFNGLHDDADPLVAPKNGRGALFTEQATPVRRRHSGLPSFVQVRGGAYFFLPGVAALRYLAA
ncbi:Dyp-type peroxidase [Amycolatopsis thermoflava]|uniref:Dyp-type peroxidase n=1 Tax=Amycolatopsis thermoflava TaxID=84480 RepID=UPI0036579BEA